MIQAHFDYTNLTRFFERLEAVIENESIPHVAGTHTRIIQNYTLQGYDYMGNPFHSPYSTGQARKRTEAGYQTSYVDLRMGTGRLYDLALDGDTLTVPEDARPIALGQVTGHSGDWPYAYEFLNASEDTNETAGKELTEFIIGEIFHN